MMGEHAGQKELFSYGVDLDRQVQADPPLRRVQASAAFSFVRAFKPQSGPSGPSPTPWGLITLLGEYFMKALPLLVVTLLMAACASSPTAPRQITFTGDYLDARKDPAAKIVPVHQEPLRVPAYLRDRALDASAVVAFMVGSEGRTSEVQIVSTTDQEFAEAVRASVAGWRYAPPVRNGIPVRVVLEETVAWKATAGSTPSGLQ